MTLGLLLWMAALMPQPVHEQACLAATVYLEARDQSKLGQAAVAEVVLRRRESGRWGETTCDVVLTHKQFAPAFTARDFRFQNPKAWDRDWKVAGDAIHMWNLPARSRIQVVPGADHFYAHNVVAAPNWASGDPIAVIGGHTFHRVGL